MNTTIEIGLFVISLLLITDCLLISIKASRTTKDSKLRYQYITISLRLTSVDSFSFVIIINKAIDVSPTQQINTYVHKKIYYQIFKNTIMFT